MPTSINEFHKGDNRDLDLLIIPKDTSRRIQNMRYIEVDGKTAVLTNVGGSEAKFSLEDGFVPVGVCEYNGVAYIASTNPSTGQSEIGCYPAPLALVNQDCSFSGWGTAKQYSPLFNFTGPNTPRDENSLSQYFRTDLLGFDCENQVEIFAREDYDGSVSLYMAQKGLPVRVYNTGFDQDGNCTSFKRRYWDNSFPNAVNLLHESDIHADVSFQGLGQAGKTRAGNWIFFARYSTENFDKTSFFTETNAIQITQGTYLSEGIRHHGDEGGKETNKSIKLRYSNIDTTYSYLEIGYMYYFSDTVEYGIIDKLYSIDPNLSTLDIEITGYEGTFETGLDEIIKTKPQYDGALTHTQLENRYFAGNLFDTTDYGDEAITDLFNFAQLIVPSHNATLQLQHRNGNGDVGIYNNEINVYNRTGYFRGEAYAYGIVYVLKNGRETQAFPIAGRDDWNLGGTPNTSGVYRFPNINVSPTVSGNLINVMGVQFDVTNAFASIPQYILDNVTGFYIVRAERQETLLYQGFTLPCYNAADGASSRGLYFLIGEYPQIEKRNEDVVPMFEEEKGILNQPNRIASFPYQTKYDFSDLFTQVFTFVNHIKRHTQQVEGKWGFHSSDHFFVKTLGIPKALVYPFGTIDFQRFTDIDPSKEDYFYQDQTYNFSTGIKYLHDVHNIAPWEQANNNSYTSYFNQGSRNDFDSMYYFLAENLADTKFIELINLESAYMSYIGIDADIQYDYRMINLYNTSVDPASFDITDLYDVKATTYFKISKYYRIADVQANNGLINDQIFYKGDCFLQRTWHKQMYNPKYGPGVKDDGGNIAAGGIDIGLFDGLIGERLYSFGVCYSFISENKINTEMRLDDFINKFYPGSYADVYEQAVKDIERESELLNPGYNKVLSSKFYNGIDLEVPFFPENKPVGIMFSNKHRPGSFLDAYRVIDLSALKEYDYRMGEIKSLQVLNNALFSIQEEGVNRHFVNEKAVLNQGSSTGELLLGTGDILDSKHQNLTDYVGSQHQWSIVSTEIAIYGVDFNKRKIWRMKGNMQMEVLSDMQGYRSTLHELCEFNNDESDRVEFFLDNPVCRTGITSVYDRKHQDIYFTWIYGSPERLDDCSIKDVGRTIVFNELQGAFHGERTADSAMRFTINEDFFAFGKLSFPSMNPDPIITSVGYLKDIYEIAGNENATTFFDNDDPDLCFVEFVVNEAADITKVFDNLELSTSSDNIYRVVYETQHQISEHFPWIEGTEASYWRDPAYTENLWKLPIIRTQDLQNPTNNIYDVDSRFRGRWIKIRIEWKTKSRIFIKSVLTHFRQSHN